jgi:hypothetical protein
LNVKNKKNKKKRKKERKKIGQDFNLGSLDQKAIAQPLALKWLG